MSDDFNEIIRIPEFEKGLKKLLKKYQTLEEDIDNLINYSLKLYHFFGVDNKGIVEITDLNLNPQKFFKVKKISSKSFKGKGANSGLRLIYKYNNELRIIELIEIYYKGNKDMENRERILKNYKS